ncbi:conserved hypothetical protein [uncultured Alphaproteobacteria bacterium]|uniref:Xylulokinase n=1 Tax=uncultured Alphaproteobacteria bacterium TaxID=91750 RepID=A0A212JYX7_9PROT|nr:conserved hypothetical protein [uncultured Alphaproteobacteria bacterium]
MNPQEIRPGARVLGIDVGTTGAKCTVYDLGGTPVASAYREYPMLHPREDWAEEDPNTWWRAVADNVRACFRSGYVAPEEIAAIGVSCTNSFIPVAADGAPLYNAILQLDQRASDEVDWLREHVGVERIFRVTGNRIARGTFSLPTVRWFLRNRRDIVADTYKFLVPSGFIIRHLTGEFSINTSRMGFTLLSDIRTGEWDAGLADAAGVPFDLLPTPYRASDVVGGVTRAAADATGLMPGTPVVAGAMDTVAAAVGAGAIAPGDIFLAIGTCGRSCFSTDTPTFDDRLMNCRHAVEGQWLGVQATNAAGASLRWFRDVFGSALSLRAEAEKRSVFELMDDLAATAEPGAGGVVYLPYLSGERCPIWDPDARGVFFGLSFATGYAEMVRAVMEGVAFSIRQGQEIALAHMPKPSRLSLGGGIGRSRLWCRIFADVLGYPIVRLRVSETETLGGAMLAAYGVGLIRSLDEMAGGVFDGCEVVEPDPAAAAIYDEMFAVYGEAYRRLAPEFAELRGIRSRRA